MPATPEGLEAVAAARVGLNITEYRRKRARGQKHCYLCRRWLPASDFGRDKDRYDGLTAACRACRSQRARATHRQPKPRRAVLGDRLVRPRDDDKVQARARVNSMVSAGLLPHPSTLPCAVCFHYGDDRRHEYDHYLGYEADHHEAVEAVCVKCHRRRDAKRRRP